MNWGHIIVRTNKWMRNWILIVISCCFRQINFNKSWTHQINLTRKLWNLKIYDIGLQIYCMYFIALGRRVLFTHPFLLHKVFNWNSTCSINFTIINYDINNCGLLTNLPHFQKQIPQIHPFSNFFFFNNISSYFISFHFIFCQTKFLSVKWG